MRSESESVKVNSLSSLYFVAPQRHTISEISSESNPAEGLVYETNVVSKKKVAEVSGHHPDCRRQSPSSKNKNPARRGLLGCDQIFSLGKANIYFVPAFGGIFPFLFCALLQRLCAHYGNSHCL